VHGPLHAAPVVVLPDGSVSFREVSPLHVGQHTLKNCVVEFAGTVTRHRTSFLPRPSENGAHEGGSASKV